MKIRRKISMTNEASMASTSDIAFLLIIFFMVTSGFIFKEGVQMLLPDKNAKSKVIAKSDEITTVHLSGAALLLNKEEVTRNRLEEDLKKKIVQKPDEIVLLKVDSDVPYQKLIDIIDVIKISQVQKLSVKINENDEKVEQ